MPVTPKKTAYSLVKAFPEQGRVESNVMSSGRVTHRFTSNSFFSNATGGMEKASCHVRGLTDQQAADAFLSFYDEAKNIARGDVSLLSEVGRRMLQARIIQAAGTGKPGIIRIHGEKPTADLCVILDHNKVTLDALRDIEADTNLSPKDRAAAMHHLLHNGAMEATPAMIAAMAYTTALDKATKGNR